MSNKRHTLLEISRSKRLQRKFREQFETALVSCGEGLAPCTDTEYILSIFINHGYWAGVFYRIYYTIENGFYHQYRYFGQEN